MPAVSAETAQEAAGNQLRDFNDNFQLGYDAAGRLARLSYGNSSAFQFYDLNGQRIFKTDSQSDANFDSQNPAGSLNPNTAGVFYQYDQSGNLLWQQTVGPASTGLLQNEAATHYYWLPNEHGDILVGFDQGANSYAVYTDHLNTPRLVTKIENPQNPRSETDTANDLPQAGYGEPQGISPLAIPVWQWSYSPFGADLANGYEARPTTIGNNFKPDLWAWVGLPETGGADPNQVAQETWRIQANLITPPTLNIRYPGQYYDFEVGLVQNWWRTYEPRLGRYVSADPIGLNGGWNRFAYVGGDGINNIDPMGLEKIILLPEADLNYPAAAAAPDIPGQLTIYSHGNQNKVNGMDATALAKFLKNGGIWKPGMPVKLDACRTGEGDQNIAKKLAEQLELRSLRQTPEH